MYNQFQCRAWNLRGAEAFYKIASTFLGNIYSVSVDLTGTGQ